MTTGPRALSDRAMRHALVDIQEADAAKRIEAAKALSTSPATFIPLRKLLKTVGRPEIRLSVVFALSWQNDMRGWEIFIKILSDKNEAPAVRAQAAEGLAYKFYRKRRGTSSFLSAIELLVASLEDSSPDVRYYSAFALGASGERGAIRALRKIARDQSTSKNFVGTVGDEAMDAIEQIDSSSRPKPTENAPM